MKHTLILLLFISTTTHAVNWDKCGSVAIAGNGAGTIVSTSSFFSSTGECGMFASVSERKKVFIVDNYKNLQTESAIGEGEYLSAYATLSGCNNSGTRNLKRILKTNFSKIYGESREHSAKESYLAIEKILNNNKTLKSSCSLKS